MAADNVMTGVGRLINNSLFEKDAYKDPKGRESKPSYKVELAFDSEDDVEELEEAIVACAVDMWGEGAEDDYYEGKIASPIKDGDDLAKAREEKGKTGDAYAGKQVLRASTHFDKHGEDAPGGVYVADENGDELDFSERGKIYNGSYGIAVVVPSAYLINGDKGVTLYLNGYQFVKDGERLRGSSVSGLFKPQIGKSSEGKGRKKKKA